MSKSRLSLLNALSSLLMSLINGLFNIVFVRLVIGHYGSDFNGLNATANQFVSMLAILEGGFTLAVNVSLVKPFVNRDYGTINGILSAACKFYNKVGILFFAVGVIAATVYTMAVNSALSKELIFTVIIMAVLPYGIRLVYLVKYTLLFQAEQKEYIITAISLIATVLGYAGIFVSVSFYLPMWTVRFWTMLFSLLSVLPLIVIAKRKYRFVDFHAKPLRSLIKGSNDVMAMRISTAVYYAAPMLVLSISSGGTILSSVYAVYNSVMIMIRSIINTVISAPRIGIGVFISENTEEKIWDFFLEYQFVANVAVVTMLSTTSALIVPFVRLYSGTIEDINYVRPDIAAFLIAIELIGLMHVPSGIFMNMYGYFKEMRNFQLISLGILLIGSFLGLNNIYILLTAILVTAIQQAICEISFTCTRIFSNKTGRLLLFLFPFVAISVLCVIFEVQIAFSLVNSWLTFLLAGVLLVATNAVVSLGTGFVFARPTFYKLLNRGKNLFSKEV